MELTEKAIILNEKDNVATALTDLDAGSSVELDTGDKVLTVKLTSTVPFGHKFSLTYIKSGAPIVKYGEVIGIATTAINAGNYVHVHNVVSTRGSTGGAEGGAK